MGPPRSAACRGRRRPVGQLGPLHSAYEVEGGAGVRGVLGRRDLAMREDVLLLARDEHVLQPLHEPPNKAHDRLSVAERRAVAALGEAADVARHHAALVVRKAGEELV